MKNIKTVAIFILIGIIVICLGALAGWYFVLRTKSGDISIGDAARGFGSAIPTANQNGSTFQNSNFGVAGTDSAPHENPSVSDANGTGGTDSIAKSGDTGNAGGSSDQTTSQSSAESGQRASSTNATSSLPNGLLQKPQTPRLWHVSKTPIAGSGFGVASSSALYYAERLGGYVFRANIYTGEILRLSNTLKPKSYGALFSRSGAVILRTVNEKTSAVESLYGTIASSSAVAPGALLGTDLDRNILDIASDPDSAGIFFTVRAPSGGTLGITAGWNGAKEKKIFSSPLSSWKPLSLADGRMIVVQKPHDGVLGYAYELQKDGSWLPLVRAVQGLTIAPNAFTPALLYGSSIGGQVQLFLRGTSTTAVSLPLNTVADKCVWAPYPAKIVKNQKPNLIAYCAVPEETPSGFLEKWYQGSAHTADTWWQIDARTGQVKKIYSPSAEFHVALDVTDPHIDPTGNFISFTNNTDQSLWVFRVIP